MVLREFFIECMLKVSPEWEKYVTLDKKGNKVLYVRLNYGLYGCINNDILFWEKLSKDLKSQGFELNPYDPCVANKIINGKQFIIVWHVDDLKMSHKDSKEVTKIIQWIENKYGEIWEKKENFTTISEWS